MGQFFNKKIKITNTLDLIFDSSGILTSSNGVF